MLPPGLYNTIIIGSGISGLFALKELKTKNINNVLILDSNPEPFGVWNINNHPSVIKETYAVSSKLYMTITDFPMDKDVPEFPHHSIILDYYKKYAKHYDLLKHVKNNVRVTKTYKKNNVWIIETNQNTYKSKNLIVATGTTNSCLNLPQDKMYQNFKGEKYHCDQFKNLRNKFVNKKILIVGVSDTAADLAEILKTNNEVTMSSKNGIWFQSRNSGAYNPTDMFYNRFFDFFIKNISDKKFSDKVFGNSEDRVILFWGKNGHGIDKWKTDVPYLNGYYVKSRDIINSISKGQITPEGAIKSISGYNVTFIDGNTKKFDVILFCTGYQASNCVKFLEEKNRYDKYKHIFSPHDKTLYFIGFIRPYLTSIPMLSELQSRWIAQEIKNNNSGLPTKEIMLKTIKLDREKQKEEFPAAHKRLMTIVDPYDYCNYIANNINATPDYFKILITNPKLYYKIIMGSWNHHVFRLNDPRKNIRQYCQQNIREISKNKSSIFIEGAILLFLKKIIMYLIGTILILFVLYKTERLPEKISNLFIKE